MIENSEFEQFGYETNEPCDVCGKKGNNRSEPRFGYVVCEKHYKIPPVEIEEWIAKRKHLQDRKG